VAFTDLGVSIPLREDRAWVHATSNDAEDDGGDEAKGHGDGCDLQSSLEFHPALLFRRPKPEGQLR
jgi:hypothetical protein